LNQASFSTLADFTAHLASESHRVNCLADEQTALTNIPEPASGNVENPVQFLSENPNFISDAVREN